MHEIVWLEFAEAQYKIIYLFNEFGNIKKKSVPLKLFSTQGRRGKKKTSWDTGPFWYFHIPVYCVEDLDICIYLIYGPNDAFPV